MDGYDEFPEELPEFRVHDWVLCELQVVPGGPLSRGRIVEIKQGDEPYSDLEVLVEFPGIEDQVWFYPYELDLDNEFEQERLI